MSFLKKHFFFFSELCSGHIPFKCKNKWANKADSDNELNVTVGRLSDQTPLFTASPKVFCNLRPGWHAHIHILG